MATSSLRQEYAPYADEPLGIVETTELRTVAAGAVDLQFARDEGEGFSSVAEWRVAHERFWRTRGLIQALTDETLVVCERFRLVQHATHPVFE